MIYVCSTTVLVGCNVFWIFVVTMLLNTKSHRIAIKRIGVLYCPKKYKQPAPSNVFWTVYVYIFLTKWNTIWCAAGSKGGAIPESRITMGATKSHNNVTSTFFNRTFASERPQVRTSGRQTRFLLRAPFSGVSRVSRARGQSQFWCPPPLRSFVAS